MNIFVTPYDYEDIFPALPHVEQKYQNFQVHLGSQNPS